MAKMKRILWINEKADFTGGCESYIYHTAKHLTKYGFQNILIYDVEGWTEPSYTQNFVESYPCVELSRQIKEINPDLIYVHRINGIDQIEKLSECGIPVIRFYHDHKLFCLREHKYKTLSLKTCRQATGIGCFPCLGFINKSNKFPGIKFACLAKLHKEQAVNRKLDGFIVASEYMKKHLELHKFKSNKIKVLPLFSWKEIENIPDIQNEGYFLLAGQLLRGKGIDLALEAMQKLPAEARLKIAGSGKQEKEFKNLTEKLGLENRVEFLGFLQKNELKELYKKCFCLLLPSRVPETFGLSGLEAMSFSKPVIASNVGGISQWLENGKNGILFDIEKKDSLSESMLKLWNNKQIAEEMGKNGQMQFLEKYQPEVHVKKLAEYFDEIISGG